MNSGIGYSNSFTMVINKVDDMKLQVSKVAIWSKDSRGVE